jgi:hypothetical protein
MAVFGLPGGAEWLVILGILVLLFVPGVLVFWFGYLTGKNAAMRETPDGSVPDPAATPGDSDA